MDFRASHSSFGGVGFGCDDKWLWDDMVVVIQRSGTSTQLRKQIDKISSEPRKKRGARGNIRLWDLGEVLCTLYKCLVSHQRSRTGFNWLLT